MKFNRSVLIALVMLLVIGAWFAFNDGKSSGKKPAPKKAAIEEQTITVVTEQIYASEHEITYTLYGRTEANREVSVKAETAGLVVATPLREGQRIKRGSLMCRQDVDARQSMVDQASAMLKTKELEYTAAQKLVERGYSSTTQAATAKAALDGARASLKQAQIERDNVNMRAPFGGIFEQQMAEIGDYLGPGQPCGLLVDLDPLIVSSELTEAQIKDIKTGQEAQIELATGEVLDGTVRFIEAKADPSTRTFGAEVSVPNTDFALKAGVTATVKFKAGKTLAQRIPSKILALDDNGVVGVKYLDYDSTVLFAEVTTIDEDRDGIWVLGLPNTAKIIVAGQEYVATGTQVEAKDISETAAP